MLAIIDVVVNAQTAEAQGLDPWLQGLVEIIDVLF